ncbi:MAG: hypothetical protein LBH69_02935, partial [Methanomassiliicoccaceae archaeon]|nr:hypothetical protein [Methanomassiliicoccaceae archaeon]
NGEKKGLTLHGNLVLGDLDFSDPAFTEDVLRYWCFFWGGNERKGREGGGVSFSVLPASLLSMRPILSAVRLTRTKIY